MQKFSAAALFLAAIAFAPALVAAQHLDYHNGHYHAHRNVPHGHDAAGHLIDRAGHHIDGHGRHTPYGVYENGAISPRSYYGASYGGLYGTYGGYQPLAIRPAGSSYYANPSYLSPSYAVPSYGANLQLDGGVYSLGALRNLSPQNLAPANQPPTIANRPPLAPIPTGLAPSRRQIIVSNPADSGADIHYSLNGYTFTIKPGYAQKFEDNRNWVIAFGSGGARGDLRYTLTAGAYRFVATSEGWDLKASKTDKPTDDIPPPLPSPE